MDFLVYGFDGKPGRLPPVLNLVRNGTRLRLRGPSRRPSFAGLDGILLPFDPYAGWREGAAGDLAALELAAAMEIRRAVATGAAVVFVQSVVCDGGEAPERPGLAAVLLADLGLQAVPLAEPEERLEVAAPAFADYLRRFGVGSAVFESGRGGAGLEPLCRTRDGRAAGVVVAEGRGGLFFLPGPAWRRPLGFYVDLAAAVTAFRSAGSPRPGSSGRCPSG